MSGVVINGKSILRSLKDEYEFYEDGSLISRDDLKKIIDYVQAFEEIVATVAVISYKPVHVNPVIDKYNNDRTQVLNIFKEALLKCDNAFHYGRLNDVLEHIYKLEEFFKHWKNLILADDKTNHDTTVMMRLLDQIKICPSWKYNS